MKNKITIKEIASMAGVSIGTVDRVLHDRGRVAATTKEKILQIAENGNYTSNPVARNLKLAKTYTIAALLPVDQYYFQMLWQGMVEEIEDKQVFGLSLKEFSVEEMQRKSISPSIMLQQLLGSSPDALVLAPHFLSISKNTSALLKEADLPLVFIDEVVPEVEYLTEINQDPYQSGLVSGKLLEPGFSKTIDLFVITFDESDLLNSAVRARINGLKSYFESNKISGVNFHDINLQAEDVSLFDFKYVLDSHDSPLHLFIPSSKSFKLHETLKSLKSVRVLKSVGFDLLHKNRLMLQDGTLDFIVQQRPKFQGKMAVDALYKHFILGAKVAKSERVPLDIITKQNLKYAQL